MIECSCSENWIKLDLTVDGFCIICQIQASFLDVAESVSLRWKKIIESVRICDHIREVKLLLVNGHLLLQFKVS